MNERGTVAIHGDYISERCDSRIMASQVVNVLIPRICEYVTLHGKKDFADVIKHLEKGKLFWIIQVLNHKGP